jgi:hypothetical protein
MDACESVEKEIQKVITKFTEIKKQSSESINEIVSVLKVIQLSLSMFQASTNTKIENLNVKSLIHALKQHTS